MADTITLAAMIAGDSIDFRAMMAREVHRERMWRIHGSDTTPAHMQIIDGVNEGSVPGNLRIMVEYANGEALA